MSTVSREGWFKAKITDHGVGQTRSELPQWVGDFSLLEHYDGEDYIDWSEYGEAITGYMVLIGHSGKELLNCDQVKKTFDWDGTSFAELDGMDLEGKVVLIKVEENEYEGKVSMQVNWIDKEDATPGGSGIKKLDKSALKDLDAKFGRKAKPKPKAKAKPKSPKSGAPKKSPPKKTPPKVGSKPAAKGMTKDEAWDKLTDTELWNETVDDREMSEAVLVDLWTKALEEMGPDEDKFSDEDWYIIHEKIAKLVYKF